MLILHGIIHGIAFSSAWQLADVPGASGRSTVRMPEAAQRAFGLLWLVALIGFAGAGLGLLFSLAWWRP